MPGDDAVCTNLCSLIYQLQEYVLPLLTDDSRVLLCQRVMCARREAPGERGLLGGGRELDGRGLAG